jgi:hypothetical protein
MQRDQDGFFGILKSRFDLERPQARFLDWDLSFRIDWIQTRRNTVQVDLPDAIAIAGARKPHLTYKVGLNGVGQIKGMQYKAFVINGANVKLPTLQQLFYFDLQPRSGNDDAPQLNVEQNIGTEAGLHLEKTLPGLPTFLKIGKVQFTVAAFRNSYLQKITELNPKGTSPIPFNTALAKTTGLEAGVSLNMFDGLLDWQSALLLLKISDPRIFKFKPERKVTSDFWLRAGQTALQCHLFYEGTQTALILSEGRSSVETLPPRWDIDFSIQRTITIKRVSGFLNFAVRNVRNGGRSELSGFFLQDRRWYASIGAKL